MVAGYRVDVSVQPHAFSKSNLRHPVVGRGGFGKSARIPERPRDQRQEWNQAPPAYPDPRPEAQCKQRQYGQPGPARPRVCMPRPGCVIHCHEAFKLVGNFHSHAYDADRHWISSCSRFICQRWAVTIQQRTAEVRVALLSRKLAKSC